MALRFCIKHDVAPRVARVEGDPDVCSRPSLALRFARVCSVYAILSTIYALYGLPCFSECSLNSCSRFTFTFTFTSCVGCGVWGEEARVLVSVGLISVQQDLHCFITCVLSASRGLCATLFCKRDMVLYFMIMDENVNVASE